MQIIFLKLKSLQRKKPTRLVTAAASPVAGPTAAAGSRSTHEVENEVVRETASPPVLCREDFRWPSCKRRVSRQSVSARLPDEYILSLTTHFTRSADSCCSIHDYLKLKVNISLYFPWFHKRLRTNRKFFPQEVSVPFFQTLRQGLTTRQFLVWHLQISKSRHLPVILGCST